MKTYRSLLYVQLWVRSHLAFCLFHSSPHRPPPLLINYQGGFERVNGFYFLNYILHNLRKITKTSKTINFVTAECGMRSQLKFKNKRFVREKSSEFLGHTGTWGPEKTNFLLILKMEAGTNSLFPLIHVHGFHSISAISIFSVSQNPTRQLEAADKGAQSGNSKDKKQNSACVCIAKGWQ